MVSLYKKREGSLRRRGGETHGRRQRQILELCVCKPKATRSCQELESARDGSPPRDFGGSRALPTSWLQTFGFQNHKGINFCCFKATQFVIYWSRPRKLIIHTPIISFNEQHETLNQKVISLFYRQVINHLAIPKQSTCFIILSSHVGFLLSFWSLSTLI